MEDHLSRQAGEEVKETPLYYVRRRPLTKSAHVRLGKTEWVIIRDRMAKHPVEFRSMSDVIRAAIRELGLEIKVVGGYFPDPPMIHCPNCKTKNARTLKGDHFECNRCGIFMGNP